MQMSDLWWGRKPGRVTSRRLIDSADFESFPNTTTTTTTMFSVVQSKSRRHFEEFFFFGFWLQTYRTKSGPPPTPKFFDGSIFRELFKKTTSLVLFFCCFNTFCCTVFQKVCPEPKKAATAFQRRDVPVADSSMWFLVGCCPGAAMMGR